MSDRLVDRVIYLLESDPEGWESFPSYTQVHVMSRVKVNWRHGIIEGAQLGFWESWRLRRAIRRSQRLAALAKVNKAIGFDPVEPAAERLSVPMQLGLGVVAGYAVVGWAWSICWALGWL